MGARAMSKQNVWDRDYSIVRQKEINKFSEKLDISRRIMYTKNNVGIFGCFLYAKK